MARIIFNDPRGLQIFDNEADGMRETSSDDIESEAELDPDVASLDRIMQAVRTVMENDGHPLPVEVEIEDSDAVMARTVLENCISNSSGSDRKLHDPEWEEFLFEGDVSVDGPSPSLSA